MAGQMTAVQPAYEVPAAEPQWNARKPSSALGARRVGCVLALLLSDVLAMALALWLAVLVRAHVFPQLRVPTPAEAFRFSHYIGHAWIWLLFLVFLVAEGLYTQRRTLWNEVGHLTKATGLGLLAVLAAIALGKLSLEFSRVTILLMGILLLVLLPASRLWTKRFLAHLNLWRKPLLILGAADTAHLVLRGINQDPVLGYHVIGLLDDDGRKQRRCLGKSYGQDVHVLGPLAMAPDILWEGRAKDILIAMPGLDEDRLVKLVRQLQGLCESIYVVPKLWGLPMMNLQIDGFLQQQVLMLKVSNNLAKPWNGWLKRGFDLFVGSVLTALTSPIMAIIALVIKVNSKGPVFFVQDRLGYRGRAFRCMKFRSMYVDGDAQLDAFLKQDPQLAAEWAKYAKLRTKDPRLTPLGLFLRRWSLDELPQLLNVLRGDMSLVGPRPYLHREQARITNHLATILEARPGMTGFWQVNGKNELTLEDRARLEVWYVQNWTLWLDVIILAKTFKAVFFRNGA